VVDEEHGRGLVLIRARELTPTRRDEPRSLTGQGRAETDRKRGAMPVERADEHPTHDFGGNSMTSLIAPSRGGVECALYRVFSPPGHGLPPHRHDHLDTFTVVQGGGMWHMNDETFELRTGDSVVVPIGVRHYLEAGPEGSAFVVAMLPGTKSFLDDGTELVPPWVC
jgi:quercetin dioxygenase-like cupin family protein